MRRKPKKNQRTQYKGLNFQYQKISKDKKGREFEKTQMTKSKINSRIRENDEEETRSVFPSLLLLNFTWYLLK
jgi:hypothetical protein